MKSDPDPLLRQEQILVSLLSPINRVRYLGNQKVVQSGNTLRISLENLETLEEHTLIFSNALGYRFNIAHNMTRLGRAYTVANSEWLREHELAPLRTQKLDGALHFIFSSSDGELEVLSFGSPSYSVLLPEKSEKT